MDSRLWILDMVLDTAMFSRSVPQAEVWRLAVSSST